MVMDLMMKQRMSTSLIETQNNTDHPSSAPPAQIGNTGLPHSAPSTLPSSAPQVHPNYRHVRIGSQMVRLVNPADLVHRVHSQHGSSRHPMSLRISHPSISPSLPFSLHPQSGHVLPHSSSARPTPGTLCPSLPLSLSQPGPQLPHSSSASQTPGTLRPSLPLSLPPQPGQVQPHSSASQTPGTLCPSLSLILSQPGPQLTHSSSVSQTRGTLRPSLPLSLPPQPGQMLPHSSSARPTPGTLCHSLPLSLNLNPGSILSLCLTVIKLQVNLYRFQMYIESVHYTAEPVTSSSEEEEGPSTRPGPSGLQQQTTRATSTARRCASRSQPVGSSSRGGGKYSNFC